MPTVLTHAEAIAVLGHMSGVHPLVAKFLYGSGLRLSETLQLRVKDLDFAQSQIIVRDGKGGNSRITMLPLSLVEPLKNHLQTIRYPHVQDLAQGYGFVYLPYALDRKYSCADCEWIRQYIFSSESLSKDSHSPNSRRAIACVTPAAKAYSWCGAFALIGAALVLLCFLGYPVNGLATEQFLPTLG